MKKLLKSEINGCCILFTGLTELIKKKILKSEQLSATVHINSSRCPLIECAAAGKKRKKKKLKKRKRKRRSWIQTQPINKQMFSKFYTVPT